MWRVVLALISTMPAVACVTVDDTPSGTTPPAQPAAVAGTPNGASSATSGIDDADGFELAALEPKSLAEGECGIFLFTPNPTPRFVFFSNDSQGFAEMMINGSASSLQRISTGGTPFAQSFSEQVFRDGVRGIEVSLSLQPGDPMNGGHEIVGGAMRLTKTDGWSMVIPVSGAAACQTVTVEQTG